MHPRDPGARSPASRLLLPLLLSGSSLATPALAVPPHDRVVVVVMENKSYDEVRTQPYTASLMTQGAMFTNAFGVAHPSQPNYFAMWAGSTLGVTNDNCPPAGTPNPSENLGHAVELAGLRWRAYSENLASAGSTACSFDGSASTGLYTRKHDPWTNFLNVDHSNERPYADLAADLAANTLPNLVFIIPNNCHNTHNSTLGCGIADGDAWLAANLPAVIAALGPKGLLVLTWDEDDSSSNNHILTVMLGAQVLTGAVSAQTLNHFTVNRMICEALGLPLFANGRFEASVTNIWKAVTPTHTSSWGHVKSMYR